MSREGLKLSLLENNNNNNGVPTLTTPTLTPTTLRNIEQMLLDSGDAPSMACEPPELHENAAGFAPPSVELPMPYEAAQPSNDRLQSSLDWVLNQQVPSSSAYHHSSPPPPPVPPVIASLIKDPSAAALPGPTNILLPLLSNLTPVSTNNNNNSTVPCSGGENTPCTTSSSSNSVLLHPQDNQLSSSPSCSALLNNEVPPSGSSSKKRPLSSRRSSLNCESSMSSLHNISPEERLKRDLRRERNKEAAARCRKRRLDQTLNLQDEVDELESKKSSLQKELDSLRAQRDELESLLSNHKAGGRQCVIILGGEGVVKKEPLEEHIPPSSNLCIKAERSEVSLACTVGGQ